MDRSAPDPLAAAIDRISGVLAQAGAAERAPWLFARSWLAECRFQLTDPAHRNASVLEDALADFFALPADFPGRPRLAAILVGAMFQARRLHESAWVDSMTRLADIAKTEPNPHPDWPKHDAAVRAVAIGLAARDLRPGFSEVFRVSARDVA